MPKKLLAISKTPDEKVTFYFDDFSTLTFEIDGDEEYTYLYNKVEHNSEAFFQLGIEDPHAIYEELGILTSHGDCPECRRQDLDKVFDYLLKHYSVESEESKEEPREPSEYDWLLN